jgi:hypothetical protein
LFKEEMEMAKVVFESNNISDVFDGDITVAISPNRKKATYTDDTTDGSLVFTGSGLKAQGEFPLFTAGTVEKLVVNDKDGILAGTLTDVSVKAKDLSEGFLANGLMGMLAVLLAGKDSIIGSDEEDMLFGFGKADLIKGGKGEDQLAGGRGDDTLTGGQHSDTFYFIPSEDGKGDDIITDFDAKGEVVDFLLIDGDEIMTTARANKNQDTLLTLGNGSTILLEDVTKAEFLAYQEALIT